MHGGEREGLGAGYNVSEPLNTGAIQLEQIVEDTKWAMHSSGDGTAMRCK